MGHPYYQGPIKHTQVRGRDGLILKLFFFCMFIDRDGVEVHKHAKRGQYPAILTEQAWSIKDLLYGERILCFGGTQQDNPKWAR